MKRTVLALLFASAAVTVLAHPHYSKTITAKNVQSGVEFTLTYTTVPSNEIHAQKAAVGEFITPRRPTLKLSSELKADKRTLAAGDYTIGVIKNSDKDWTMALYPGVPARGVPVDMSKVVKLDSMLESNKGTAEHMLVDLTPGHGKFEGKTVLTMHFGTLFLAGVLD